MPILNIDKPLVEEYLIEEYFDMKKNLFFWLFIFIFFFLSCGKKITKQDTVPPTCEIVFPPNNYTVPEDSNSIEIKVMLRIMRR